MAAFTADITFQNTIHCISLLLGLETMLEGLRIRKSATVKGHHIELGFLVIFKVLKHQYKYDQMLYMILGFLRNPRVRFVKRLFGFV